MTLGTRIFTWLKGELVGTDGFGNRYYREKNPPADPMKEKRWVLYAGEPEASKVPPDWHAWLHRIVVPPPKPGERPARAWEKQHLPNLTGTELAYRPPGHQLKGAQRAKSVSDYEPWRPA